MEGGGQEGEFLCSSCSQQVKSAQLYSAVALQQALGEGQAAAGRDETWTSSAKVCGGHLAGRPG
jgi:hypothetical protein